MRRVVLFAVALLLCGSVAYAKEASRVAYADLINSKGEKIGTARITEIQNGVKIVLRVSKLPPGLHAFHIHGVGKAEPPDFKTAGGHFNPEGKKHGMKNPEGAHAGDLPNLLVNPNGTGQIEVIVPRVTLGPDRPGQAYSLLKPGGTSVVIHEKADDEMTDPAGNAGARIACGVITQ